MKNPKPASRSASRPTSAKPAKRLEWSPRADDDKFQAWVFIANDNVEAADRVLVRIEQQAELLLSQPFMGRAGRVPRTREMPVPQTPFLLVYELYELSPEEVRLLEGTSS